MSMSFVSDTLDGRSVSEILSDPTVTQMAATLAEDNITLDGFRLPQETRDELADLTDRDLRTRAIQAFIELGLRKGTPASVEASMAARAGQIRALENLSEIHQALSTGEPLAA